MCVGLVVMYCSIESEEVGKSLSCVDGVDGGVGLSWVYALVRSCCSVGVSVWVLWGVRVCKCCCEVVMVFGGSVVGVVSSWGGVCVNCWWREGTCDWLVSWSVWKQVFSAGSSYSNRA